MAPQPGRIYVPDNPMMPRRLVVEVRDDRVFYRVERMRNARIKRWLPPRSCSLDIWADWAVDAWEIRAR